MEIGCRISAWALLIHIGLKNVAQEHAWWEIAYFVAALAGIFPVFFLWKLITIPVAMEREQKEIAVNQARDFATREAEFTDQVERLSKSPFDDARLEAVRKTFRELPDEWMRALTCEAVKRGSMHEREAMEFLRTVGHPQNVGSQPLANLWYRTGWFDNESNDRFAIKTKFESELGSICSEQKPPGA